MANVVEDIGAYFVSLGTDNEILQNLGANSFTVGTNLFYVMEPPDPTDCVTIIPYPGRPADREHRGAQYPAIQVRVKADGVQKAYLVAQSIINDLHQHPSLGSNIPMACFSNQSAPMFLKWDEEDYPVYVCNFELMIRKHSVD